MSSLETKIASLPPERRALLELLAKTRGQSVGTARGGDEGPAAGVFSLIKPEDRTRLPPGLEDAYPLASMQLGMLYHTNLTRDQEVPAYHNVFLFDVRFPVSPRLLWRAIQIVVHRHAILRTAFDLERFSEPLQLVHRRASVALPLHDLTALKAADQERALEGFLLIERRRILDVGKPPLLRFFLHLLGPALSRLSMTESHAITEGWSTYQNLGEIHSVYLDLAAGRAPRLSPTSTVPYREFIRLEQAALVSPEHREFWRRALRDSSLASPTRWPAALRRLAGGGERTHRIPLPESLLDGIKQLSRRLALPLKSVLTAAHLKVVSQFVGERDVTVAYHVHGRPEQLGGEYLRGVFNNTVPLRLRLAGGSWKTLIERTFQAEMDFLPFQRYPVAAMQRDGELKGHFELQVGYVNFHLFGELERPDGIVEAAGRDRSLSHFPLILYFWGTGEGPETLSLWIENADGSVTNTQVACLAGWYRVVLERMVAEPEASHELMDNLSAPERQQILREWNDTLAPLRREGTLHQLVAARAVKQPAAIAVVEPGVAISFAELENRANRLAQALLSMGVAPGERVGIHLTRSSALVVSALAVLKAGGTYVPLDPVFPRDRIGWILARLEVSCLVTEPILWAHLEGIEEQVPSLAHLVLVAGDGETETGERVPRPSPQVWRPAQLARFTTAAPPELASADHFAYVIFTSGSTGHPKGVMVRHRPVLQLIDWITTAFSMGTRDQVLFVTSLSFDLSVYDIFGLLAAGGSIRVASDEENRDPSRLLRILLTEPITFWDSAPAALQQLVPLFPRAPTASALRLVFLSGDWIPLTIPGELKTVFPAAQVIGLGGATEATVWSNFFPIHDVDPAWTSIPYGRPIPNARYHVLDTSFNPCPMGVAGDLYIGGDCLASGYAEAPALTAERFLPDPFSERGGELIYRTGDRARYWPDGHLEFLGRLDRQVKLRGYRVELGEIEATLQSYSGVSAAVAEIKEVGGSRHLVAYVQPEGEPPTAAELRAHLQRTLPDYMVPSFFVILDTFPVTANGKLDRKALPLPRTEASNEGNFQEPRTPTEGVVAAIWEEILGAQRVGRADDFFALGGHSLVAMQVISRLGRAFAIDLPLRLLFEQSTVGALAREVDHLRSTAGGARPALLPVARRDQPLPLSFAQQRMWFLSHLEPDSTAYSMPLAVRVEGALSIRALTTSLNVIRARHEPLRTTYRASEDGAVQVVAPPWHQPLPVLDLTAVAATAAELAEQLLRREARRPFDLERGPVLRAWLIRLAPLRHVLLSTLHHIAGDGWSLMVIRREMVAVYSAITRGVEWSLPALPVQYADYAVWQRQWLVGTVLEDKLGYWRRQLAGLPPALELPTDRPRRPLSAAHGATVGQGLPAPLSAAIRRLGRALSATPFMILLAAFVALLSRWSGARDLAVGTPVAGRDELELEGLVGLFVNTLALRINLEGAPNFEQLVLRIRDVQLEAHGHLELPFERVVEALGVERSLVFTPLFQVMLVMEVGDLEGDSSPAEASELSWQPLPGAGEGAGFELTLTAADRGETLRLSLEYRRDLFDRSTALRLLSNLEALLGTAVALPLSPVEHLEILTTAQRHQLLLEWSGGAAETQPELVLEKLARVAEETPDAVAVQAGIDQLSYAELWRSAGHLAARLRARGAGAEEIVAIAAERGVALISGMLGVWNCGAAYLPLDQELPAARRQLMLSAAGVRLGVATSADLAASLERDGLEPLLISAGEGPATIAGTAMDPDQLAYVIYTSGSTGRPKGVAISHRALGTFLAGAAKVVRLRPEDHALQFAALSFDASVEDILLPLTAGSRLLMLESARLGAEEFLRFCLRHAVTVLDLPTAFWHELAAVEDTTEVSPVRLTIIGGEQARQEALEAWFRGAMKRSVLVNGYGPTETTVAATWTVLDAADGRPAIGRALPGYSAYVLDRSGGAAATGCPGELVIGGTALARGYLGLAARTAESFVPDAWASQPGARIYRTGDRGRFRADGRLEMLGRLDHQVKLRGFRIELGEIESALASLGVAGEVAVILLESEGQASRIVAFLAGEDAAAINRQALTRDLSALLPEYMLPSSYLSLPKLPLTVSGKVDRRALHSLAATTEVEERVFLPPRTATEARLASIWAEVLGIDAIGREDHFFDLGGHSLLAMQVVTRANRALGVEVPLRWLFEHPELAALARAIESLKSGAQRLARPLLTTISRQGEALPLSFAQQRMWFLDRLEPNSPRYNMPSALSLVGELSVVDLGASLRDVEVRHEVLRTTYREIDGELSQLVSPPLERVLPVVDLAALAAASKAQAERLAWREARRPFSLLHGPILRTCLLRLAGAEHLLLVTLHHIAGDGWSLDILSREVAALYSARRRGQLLHLPALPLQYADFAAWQRRWLVGEALETQLGYWRESLAGLPLALDLPTDRRRESLAAAPAATVGRLLPASLGRGLRQLQRRLGVTPFMTALAGFAALLSRWSGARDLAIGTPVSGRGELELEVVVGLFINTLALRMDLRDRPNFETLVRRVRDVELEGQAHQDLPFDRVVEVVMPERSLLFTPIFQVMLLHEDSAGGRVPPATTTGELVWSSVPTPALSTDFELTLTVAERGDELALQLEYRRDLFDATTASRALVWLETLISEALSSPQAPIDTLTLQPPAERHQLLHEWNRSPLPAGELLIPRRLEELASQRAEAVALQAGSEQLSYRELWRRASALGLELRDRGLEAEQVVGLVAEHGCECVVAMVGIWSVGGAHVPIDPRLPVSRQRLMAQDTALKLVVTTRRELAAALDDREVLAFDEPRRLEGGVCPQILPQQLAYVIYTSGSTGRPKGVACTHGAVGTYVKVVAERLDYSVEDRAAWFSSPSFDGTFEEVFAPLTTGCRLFVRPPGPLSAEEWADLCHRHAVTVMDLPTAFWHELVPVAARYPWSDLRMTIIGGEQARHEAVESWQRAVEGRSRLLNGYGPTETTVAITFAELTLEPGRPVIGRTLPGDCVWVVDERLREVALGCTGQLVVGGGGVSRGYLGLPALTAQRFLPDSWSENPGARLYLSGDKARFRPDGQLEVLGRIDHQVKVRGFRVELGEIEEAISTVLPGRDIAVLMRHDPQLGERLIAYIGDFGNEAINRDALTEQLRSRLPEHMVPNTLVVVPRLPQTVTGKIDRPALEALGVEALESKGAAFMPPRSPVETRLAALFESVLQVPAVGLRDDFFRLGGHSLLAVRLVSRIREAFGVELPLAALFEAPTLELLAARLAPAAGLQETVLVPLVASAGATKLFLVHPIGGQVFCYLELARRLAPEFAVHGFQARLSLLNQVQSLEELASRYVEEVRAVQPEGPYLLGGWSAGGVIAFEMARQLHLMDQPLGPVLLLDSYVAGLEEQQQASSTRQLLAWFASDLAGLANRTLDLELDWQEGEGEEPPWAELLAQGRALELLPADLGEEEVRGLFAVFARLVELESRHQPREYQGATWLLQATNGATSSLPGWRPVATGELKVSTLATDHYNLLRQPIVNELGALLLAELAAAGKRP